MGTTTKNQVIVSARQEGGASWSPQSEARVTSAPEDGDFNEMPSMDVCKEDESVSTTNVDGFAQGFGGDTDVSGGVNTTSLNNGFSPKTMKNPDDLYGVMAMDTSDLADSGGFAERNNYYDRM